MTRTALLSAIVSLCALGQQRDPADYVNPNIGGIGQMLPGVAPTVNLPHGMMRIAPITTPGIMDRYLADKIFGFPAGGVNLMPSTGPEQTDASRYASEYDHDLETATPYYYTATLEKSNIVVEYTVSERATFYQIAFPERASPHILFTVPRNGEIKQLSPTSLAGRNIAAETGYFWAEFSKPVSSSKTLADIPLPKTRQQPTGIGHGILANFTPGKGERIGVRVGMSYISVEQARRNLQREISDWSFYRARARARAAWNQALGKIAVKGGTEDERTIFYTALYRTLSRGTDITEEGQYYSGYDNKIHSTEGRHFYTADAFWDTYRSLHPVQLLLDPQGQMDLAWSLVQMYEQSGWMPNTPSLRGGQRGMIGHHATATIADTYMKGYRDFDVEKAYQGMKKNALESTMLRRRSGPATGLDRVYMEKGFFPALGKNEKETVVEVDPFEKRQAVSITLENAYDDWCLAQIAKALNKTDDYEFFLKRAHELWPNAASYSVFADA